MDQFVYVEAHHVVICKTCKHAVSVAHLDRHIRKIKLHNVQLYNRNTRHGVVEAFQSKETVEIGAIVIPTEIVPSIDGLDVFTDGLRCAVPGFNCKYITRHEKQIQAHARNTHDWVSPRVRGRPAKGADNHKTESMQRPWKDNITCQQFRRDGPKSELFEVSITAGDERRLVHRAGTTDADWRRRLDQTRRTIRQVKGEIEEQEKDLVHKPTKGDVSPWIQRTGWARYLEGYRRKKLLRLLGPPDEETERDLVQIERRLIKVIRVAQATTATRVGVFIRQEINRKDKNNEAKKPFNPDMESDTFKRYCDEFKRVVRCIYRVWKRGQQGDDERISSCSDSDSSVRSSDENGAVREIDSREVVARRPPPRKLPEFTMTETQRHWIQTIVTEIDSIGEVAETTEEEDEEFRTGRLDRANRAILEWCIRLLGDELGGPAGNEFHNPIIAALAIVGIRVDGGWVSALNYTPKLSAIVKVCRIMVVQQAWELAKDNGNDQGMFGYTRTMVEGFMTTHNPSPMKWIHDVRRYGYKIRMTTMSPGTIQWEGEKLRYRDIVFTRLDFQSMVHSVVEKASRVLMEEVLLFENEEVQRRDLPVIPWESIRDNQADDTVGLYFVEEERNHEIWPVDGMDWLVERVYNKESLRMEFVRNEEEQEEQEIEEPDTTPPRGVMPAHPWNTSRVEKWMRAVVRFKELLLLLMHFTGGGPARGQEILTIQYRNTDGNPSRNIYVEGGMVVYVTQYHKGYGFSGMPKIVYRYLPREVGELLVWYLWLVMPLQQHFEVMIKGATRFDPMLWPSSGDADSRKWTGERMKRIMLRETAESMGVALDIADYRQCAAAMTDKWLGGRLEGFEELTEEMMEEDEEDEGCYWRPGDNAVHLQFAHSSYEASIGYARGIEESNASTLAMRVRWRMVSEKWHKHLRFPSAMGSEPAWDTVDGNRRVRATTKEKDWQEEDKHVTFRKARALQKVDIESAFERLMGPGAQFRGVQEVTLRAISGSKARILAIMGTGSGKSLTFMLPATFEGAGTTIVVVPMIALRADMKRRCDDAGIRCVEWDSRRQPDKASIVLVTPESIFRKGFQGFVNRLRGMHRLDRLVIDECHTILDSSDTFRPGMARLRQVMTIGCQVVMLTATLPPSEESSFKKRMGLEDVEVAVFRTGTTRANIVYECQDYDGSDEAAVELIASFRQGLKEAGENGKMIVYVQGTRERVEKLAEALKEAAFHSQIGEREKRRILDDLINSKTRLVVATNALGMGVDIPDIRMVVHVDVPDRLRDYAQESGRAGRDGRRSRAIILSRQARVRVNGEADEEATNIYARAALNMPGRREMREFVEGRVCRRVVLQGYLDGNKERGDCKDEEERCDVCEGRRFAAGASAVAEKEDGLVEEGNYAKDVADRERLEEQGRIIVSEEAKFIEQVRQAAEEWAGVCSICKIKNLPASRSRHPTHQCRQDPGDIIKGQIKKMRAQVMLEPFAGCRGCQLPQDICERWEVAVVGFVQTAIKCQWQFVVIDVVAALMTCGFRAFSVESEGEDEVVYNGGSQFVFEWMAADRVVVSKEERVFQWYGGRVKVGRVETCRLCQVFLRLVEAFRERPEQFRVEDDR